MTTRQLKKNFWNDLWKALLGKIPYILLGYIIYPFIKRTETRMKYHSKEGGWYNKQLWYMLNDDEIERYGVDFDIKKIEDKGIDTSTRWGRFKASYWFNAIRNPAGNYMFTNAPEINPTSYQIKEIEIDRITKNEKRISPLLWAFWVLGKEGKLNNMIGVVNEPVSHIGEGKIWYHPGNIKTLLYCRWSHTRKFNFKWFFIYTEFAIGTNDVKYDIVYKIRFKLPENVIEL